MQDRSSQPTHPARRDAGRVLTGLGLLFGLPGMFVQPARAVTPRELRVITGGDSPSARQILALLKQRYPQLIADGNPAAFDARRPTVIHVAIGSAALQKALGAELKGPLVSVMVSSQSFRQALGMDVNGYRERGLVGGVFADTSPAAQMLLINGLYGNRPPVGVLLSDASAYLDKPLRQAATQAGLALAIERVAPSADVVRALTRLRDAEVLLAVPDNTLYTADTLRAILESTYRRAMPVIGFSAATVAAGTLASAYCSLDDMVADLAILVDEIAGGAMPEPRFPQYWRVAVNESVARSLGVPVDDKVRQMGHQPAGRAA